MSNTNTSNGLAPETDGLARSIRRLYWSARKRVVPHSTVTLPFDNDLKIAVRCVDRLGRRVYLDGYSDRELAILLNAALRPGMTYFDVGAHFGQFALVAGKRVGESGQVHAFEPTQGTFAQLKNNIELNGLKQVTVNHCAVSNEPGEVELNVCESGLGEFNSIGKPSRPDERIAGVERIRAIALDAYCAEHSIEQVNLMKIDVEGAEMKVLEGGSKLFSSEHAPTLSVEFNENTCAPMGYSCADLREKLESFGYGLYAFDIERLVISPEPKRDYRDGTINLIATKDQEAFQALLSG